MSVQNIQIEDVMAWLWDRLPMEMNCQDPFHRQEEEHQSEATNMMLECLTALMNGEFESDRSESS